MLKLEIVSNEDNRKHGFNISRKEGEKDYQVIVSSTLSYDSAEEAQKSGENILKRIEEAENFKLNL